MGELARRLDRKFDAWIECRMREQLPDLGGEIDGLFERFRRESRGQPGQDGPLDRHGVLGVQAHRIVPANETGRASAVGDGSVRLQHVELKLRSAGVADTTFLRYSSVIGHVDLDNHPEYFGELRALEVSPGHPRLCARWDAKQHCFVFSIEASLPFDRGTTQYEEIRELVCRVALQADRIEEELLARDQDAMSAKEEAGDDIHPEATNTLRRRSANDESTTARRPQGLERVQYILGNRAGMGWSDRGDEVIVDMAAAGHAANDEAAAAGRPLTHARKQSVRIRRDDNEYVFATTVLRAHSTAQVATEGDRFEYVLTGGDEH